MNTFENKVAVITGCAHGIGRCIAEEFRKNGASVCEIDKAEGDHFAGDISDKVVLERFSEQVIAEHGHIDYLINNALPLMKGIDECSYEKFQYALSVGVTAPFYLSKLFAPYFNPGGSIINISSSRDRMSQPQTESYTAAKGGIAALTHSLPRRAIMVYGTRYVDTGYVSSLLRCGMLDGNIEKVIDSNEIPDEDGEANFIAEGWQYGFEKDTIDVQIDNEFCIFAAEGAYTAEDDYLPEGVMQFMATVDEVTDDGYVIVKTDTQSERFPQIKKDDRYRLSMDAYDPGIYNGEFVPGNVLTVACKGNFEGEDPVTITDVYSFSPVGSNPCQRSES